MFDLLGFLVMLTGLAIFVAAYVWLSRLAARRLLRPARKGLGLEHPVDRRGRASWEELTGTWGGHRVHVEFTPGSRTEPSAIRYELRPASPLPVAGNLRLRRRHLLDRLAVRLGLARRLWRREYPAAERVFVEAEDDGYAYALLADGHFRQAASPLLDKAFARLDIGPEKVQLTITGVSWRRNRLLSPRHVRRVLSGLDALAACDYQVDASAAPATPMSGAPPTQHALPRNLKPVILFACALMFIGPLLLWWGTRYPPLTWEAHFLGLSIGGVLTVIYAMLLFLAVRGHSKSLGDFTTLLLAGVVGFPSFCAGVLVVSNGFADAAEARPVLARVVRVDQDEDRVLVQPLEPPYRGRAYLDIEQTWEVEPGTLLSARIRPGAWGFAWVEGGDRLTQEH